MIYSLVVFSNAMTAWSVGEDEVEKYRSTESQKQRYIDGDGGGAVVLLTITLQTQVTKVASSVFKSTSVNDEGPIDVVATRSSRSVGICWNIIVVIERGVPAAAARAMEQSEKNCWM